MLEPEFEKNLNIAIGRKIKAARLVSDKTQLMLSDAMGISFQQLQKYESGKSHITAARLKLISQLLDYPVFYFFDEISEEQIHTQNYLVITKKHEQLILLLNKIKQKNPANLKQIFKFIRKIEEIIS